MPSLVREFRRRIWEDHRRPTGGDELLTVQGESETPLAAEENG